MEMEKIQGMIEDIQQKDGRYSVKIAGKRYSTFDKELGSKLSTGQNVKISYTNNKSSQGVTFHNIKEVEVLGMEIDPETKRKYRIMCLSYAKDLVNGNTIKLEKLLPLAKGMYEWVMKQ